MATHGWCGAQFSLPKSETFTFLTADWTLPSVDFIDPAYRKLTVFDFGQLSTWIGVSDASRIVRAGFRFVSKPTYTWQAFVEHIHIDRSSGVDFFSLHHPGQQVRVAMDLKNGQLDFTDLTKRAKPRSHPLPQTTSATLAVVGVEPLSPFVGDEALTQGLSNEFIGLRWGQVIFDNVDYDWEKGQLAGRKAPFPVAQMGGASTRDLGAAINLFGNQQPEVGSGAVADIPRAGCVRCTSYLSTKDKGSLSKFPPPTGFTAGGGEATSSAWATLSRTKS